MTTARPTGTVMLWFGQISAAFSYISLPFIGVNIFATIQTTSASRIDGRIAMTKRRIRACLFSRVIMPYRLLRRKLGFLRLRLRAVRAIGKRFVVFLSAVSAHDCVVILFLAHIRCTFFESKLFSEARRSYHCGMHRKTSRPFIFPVIFSIVDSA